MPQPPIKPTSGPVEPSQQMVGNEEAFVPFKPVVGALADNTLYPKPLVDAINAERDYDVALANTGSLGKTIQALNGVRPELVDKAMYLFRKTGVNPDLHAQGIASLEEQSRLMDAFHELSAKDKDGNYRYPYTMSYLQNDTVKMGQLMNHIPTFTQMENEYIQSKEDFWLQASRWASVPLLGVKDAINTVNFYGQGLPGFMGDSFKRGYDGWNALLPEDLSPMSGMAGNAVEKATYQGLRMIPSLVAGGAIGKAAKGTISIGNAVAGLFSAEAIASTAERDAQENKSNVGALLDTFTYGMASYLLGGGQAGAAVEKIAAGQAAGSLFGGAKNIALGTLKGTAAMQGQALIGRAMDWATLNEEDRQMEDLRPMDWLSESAKNIPSEVLLFGFMHFAGEITSYAAGRIRNDSIKKAASKLMDLLEKEAPIGAMRNIIEKNGDSDGASVSAEKVLSQFQDAGDLEKFAKDQGTTPEEIQQKAKNGEDIQISKSRAAINNNDVFNKLVDAGDLKVNGYDQDGIKDLIQEAQKRSERIISDIQATRATIKSNGKVEIPDLPPDLQKIRTLLITSEREGGMALTPERANVQTAVLKAQFQRLAAEEGKDLDMWLKDNPIEVKREKFTEYVSRIAKEAKEKASGMMQPDKQSAEDAEGGTFYQKQKAVGPRGAINITGNKSVISLFERADSSTLLHEGAHLMFLRWEDYIKNGIGSEQFKKDFETLKGWLGKDAFDEKGNLTRNPNGGHERLARAFEAYLMEGKAPSRELVPAFERLAQWLADVYNSAKKYLNADKLTPEMRAVFDRRLASDAQIAQAKEFYKITDSIVEKHGSKPGSREKAKEGRQKAEADLQERQAAKLFNAYKRSQGGESAIRKRLAEEYDKTPVGAALKLASENGGLNREAFEAEYGPELADALADKYKGIFKKNGQLTLNEIAPDNDGDMFLSDISKTPNKAEAIDVAWEVFKSTTERELLSADATKAGLTAADDTILSSEAVLKHVQADLQLLSDDLGRAKKAAEVSVEQQAMKAAAEREINGIIGEDAGNPQPYLLKVRSLANEIKKIADKKTITDSDKQELYNLRAKQLQNLLYAREAQTASRVIERIRRWSLPSEVKRRMDNMAFGERGLTASVLNNLGNKTEVDPAFSSEVADGTTGTLSAWLYDYDPVLYANMPGDFIGDKAFSTEGIMNIRYGDMKRAYEALQGVYKSGRLTLADGKETSRGQAKELVKTYVGTMSTLKQYNINDETNPLNKYFLKGWSQAGAEYMTMDHRAGAIDADMSGKGAFASLVSKAATHEGMAKNAETADLKDLGKAIKPLFKAVERIEKQAGGKLFLPETFGITLDPRFKEHGRTGGKISVENLMAMVAHTGTADNYAKLKAGWGLSDADVLKVFKLFTKREIEAIREAQAVLGKDKEEMGRVYLKKHQESPKWLEGRKMEFEDANGEKVILDGAYMPINYDHTLIARAAKRPIREGDLNVEIDRDVGRSGYAQMGVGEGALTARSAVNENDWRPISLEFTTPMERHIAWKARYIHQQEFLDQARSIVLDREFRQSVINKLGIDHYKALRNWVADMADPMRRSLKSDAAWRALENYAKTSALAIRPDNLVSWNISMVNAITAIGNGDWAKGISALRQIYPDMRGVEDILTLSGKMNDNEKTSLFTTIRSISPSMDARWSASVARHEKAKLSLLSADRKGGDALKTLDHWNDMSIEALDIGSSYYIWWGAYKVRMGELAKTNAPIEEQINTARDYADRIVRDVQPLRDTATSSEYSKGSLPADRESWLMQWMKNLPLFRTYISQAASRIHSNLMGINRGYATGGRYLQHLTLDVVAEPMMQAMWRSVVWGNSLTGIGLAGAALSGVASATGPVGVIIGRGLEEYTGGGKGSTQKNKDIRDVVQNTLLPGTLARPLGVISNLERLGEKMVNRRYVDKSQIVKTALDSAQMATSLFTGTNIPIGNTYRSISGGYETLTGKDILTGVRKRLPAIKPMPNRPQQANPPPIGTEGIHVP